MIIMRQNLLIRIYRKSPPNRNKTYICHRPRFERNSGYSLYGGKRKKKVRIFMDRLVDLVSCHFHFGCESLNYYCIGLFGDGHSGIDVGMIRNFPRLTNPNGEDLLNSDAFLCNHKFLGC